MWRFRAHEILTELPFIDRRCSICNAAVSEEKERVGKESQIWNEAQIEAEETQA